MRFMITSTPGENYDPKTAAPPGVSVIEAHMKFNEEMHNAGVLVAAEGLNPAGKQARVGVKNGKRVVLDGPFAETKELIGGFYLIDVKSREEAIAWAMRCPTGLGFDEVLTILQMTDAEDLPPEMLSLIERCAPIWSKTFSKVRRSSKAVSAER